MILKKFENNIAHFQHEGHVRRVFGTLIEFVTDPDEDTPYSRIETIIFPKHDDHHKEQVETARNLMASGKKVKVNARTALKPKAEVFFEGFEEIDFQN